MFAATQSFTTEINVWVDRVTLTITIFGVIASAIINFKAWRISIGKLRKVFLMCFWMSLFYIPAYGFALLPGGHSAEWSSFMLGLGWIVWWGPPWSAFGLLALHEHKRRSDLLKKLDQEKGLEVHE